MGQATMDLPDPLEMPQAAGLAGTDDLLAQLAGDEIDRLLAEADEEHAAPTPAIAEAAVASPTPDSAATVQTDSTSEENLAASAAPSAPAALANAGTADELDALLSQIDPGAAPASIAPASNDEVFPPADPEKPQTVAQPAPEIAAKSADAPTASADAAIPSVPGPESLDGVMSAAERDALRINDLAAEAEAAEKQDAAVSGATSISLSEIQVSPAKSDTGPRASRIVRPVIRLLEFINAPLSFIPDALRDTLGKVGILTLVNSIAVLVYVIFVRH